MNFRIGYNSDGKQVSKEVLSVSHLFISYLSNQQIRDFYLQLLNENDSIINHFLLISKEENIIPITASLSLNNYVYDNPEKGSILHRSKLFSQINQLFTKRKKQKKLSKGLILIMIDDIWQLVPRLNKRNSGLLKELLHKGAIHNIFFAIGSTLPYRNLLVQLMQPVIVKHNPVNEIGAEMIINADNLLFFREKNQLEFENYYPKTK